jgi:hypothetical protein
LFSFNTQDADDSEDFDFIDLDDLTSGGKVQNPQRAAQNLGQILYQGPIPRLLNLQLQRLRCSRLERFSIGEN